MIWSDQGDEWIYGSVLKYTQLFFYWPYILEREHWRRSEIFGMKRFKALSKI